MASDIYSIVSGVRNGKRRIIGFAKTRPSAEIIRADNSHAHTAIEITLGSLTDALAREAEAVAEAQPRDVGVDDKPLLATKSVQRPRGPR